MASCVGFRSNEEFPAQAVVPATVQANCPPSCHSPNCPAFPLSFPPPIPISILRHSPVPLSPSLIFYLFIHSHESFYPYTVIPPSFVPPTVSGHPSCNPLIWAVFSTYSPNPQPLSSPEHTNQDASLLGHFISQQEKPENTKQPVNAM